MKTLIPVFLLFVLATGVSATFSKPKILGNYEGKLESYMLLVEGNQVKVEEAAILLEVFESKIKITVTHKNEVLEEFYNYAILSTEKSGTVLLLSKESSSATGELTVSKKGDKCTLKGSIYSTSIDFVKVKK